MKNNKVALKHTIVVFLIFIAECVCAQQQPIMERNHNALPKYFPLKKNDFVRVSSGYGYRKHPIEMKSKMHFGIDLVATKGKPVYTTATGIVQKVSYEKGYGNHVVIAHFQEIKTLYGHLWVIVVRQGQKVKQGDLIGFVGDTGKVTGPHLHYEVWVKDKKVDPLLVWKNLLKMNTKKMAINAKTMNNG
ncbi:M23 family metallopeptidase [Aquimarina mytili]|uniref:M23 family metallopeptidase n=1 Tax=Aquimarina mytili TaxID=874423 RepID=A0A937D7U2_9FLAO|nr:M23 family metallopeptidase [Aquimarina mytili]MBL0683425.1 M23 family metallopeptidase [Aquimarina mytili]